MMIRCVLAGVLLLVLVNVAASQELDELEILAQSDGAILDDQRAESWVRRVKRDAATDCPCIKDWLKNKMAHLKIKKEALGRLIVFKEKELIDMDEAMDLLAQKAKLKKKLDRTTDPDRQERLERRLSRLCTKLDEIMEMYGIEDPTADGIAAHIKMCQEQLDNLKIKLECLERLCRWLQSTWRQLYSDEDSSGGDPSDTAPPCGCVWESILNGLSADLKAKKANITEQIEAKKKEIKDFEILETFLRKLLKLLSNLPGMGSTDGQDFITTILNTLARWLAWVEAHLKMCREKLAELEHELKVLECMCEEIESWRG